METKKPKTNVFIVLSQVVGEVGLDRLKKANERIETLEKKLNDSLPPKLPVPYSVRSAEDRKKRQKVLDKKNKEKKKPLRSGRIKTEEKIAKAKRHEDVKAFPQRCASSNLPRLAVRRFSKWVLNTYGRTVSSEESFFFHRAASIVEDAFRSYKCLDNLFMGYVCIIYKNRGLC